MSDLKNVAIYVSSRAGKSSAERVAIRNHILYEVRKEPGATVVDFEADAPIALVNITEEFKQNLKKKFPDVAIDDEIVYSRIDPAPKKPGSFKP